MDEPLTDIASIYGQLPNVPEQPHQSRPELRPICTRHLIINAANRDITRDHNIAKEYARTCRAATKQISLILEDCETKLRQCRKLCFRAASQKYSVARQFTQEESKNEYMQQQVVLLKDYIQEAQRQWIQITTIRKEWQRKQKLIKVLTRTAWLVLEYIRAVDLTERMLEIRTKRTKIACDQHWAKTTVMKKMLMRELYNALAWDELEERSIINELTMVIPSLY